MAVLLTQIAFLGHDAAHRQFWSKSGSGSSNDKQSTADPSEDLNAKIRLFLNGWNERCNPFVWTKTAKQILKKANRQTTSNTDH